MRIRLESVGCRLNIGEVESWARRLAAGGHEIVGPDAPAELCIFNTCTVTACAAGSNAIGDAFRIIQNGYARAMICGGTEAAMTPLGSMPVASMWPWSR